MKETYGNDFRAGKKNIDELHRQLIRELTQESRHQDKFNYIFADICSIMQDLGWEAKDTIITQVAGSLKKDKFIVIKNESLNPRPVKSSLPMGEGIPVKIS